MRRKKDDKRVLRAGNGMDTRNSRRSNRRSFGFSNNRPSPPQHRQKNKKKRNTKTVLIMIIVLLAFVIGAGIGIMFSFDNVSDNNNNTTVKNETHYENVTVEMTTNLNQSDQVVFDEADAVDYNENQTDIILKEEDRVYYEPYADLEEQET